MRDLGPFLVQPTETVRAAMARIDQNAKRIVLATGDGGRLIGTVTDGDIRRGLLGGLALDDTVQDLLDRKPPHLKRPPVTLPVGSSAARQREEMARRKVHHLPLVDEGGVVHDIVFFDELMEGELLPLHAVVMAGGLGSRLGELTRNVPKPMLPLGDRPILEWILDGLRLSGIQHVTVTTHFQAHVIREHFGDGRRFDVEIDYVHEERPRGTAGSLRRFQDSEVPLLVMNGDILTKVDFRAMDRFHRENSADLTVAVREHQMVHPYGVIESDGVEVRTVREKPVFTSFINAGIYIVSPEILAKIPEEGRYDMTDLMRAAVEAGRKVVSFPVYEYWRDIGQLDDYHRAKDDVGAWGA